MNETKKISIFYGDIKEIKKLNNYITETLQTETHLSKLFNKGLIDVNQVDYSKIFYDCCKFCQKNSFHSICRVEDGKIKKDMDLFIFDD